MVQVSRGKILKQWLGPSVPFLCTNKRVKSLGTWMLKFSNLRGVILAIYNLSPSERLLGAEGSGWNKQQQKNQEPFGPRKSSF